MKMCSRPPERKLCVGSYQGSVRVAMKFRISFLVVFKVSAFLADLAEFLVPSTVFLGSHEDPCTSKERAKLMLVV